MTVISVKTYVLDGKIIQEGIADPAKDVIWRRVLDVSEQQVRSALILLGWTPPGATSVEQPDHLHGATKMIATDPDAGVWDQGDVL